MTDQTFEEKVQQIASEMRAAMHREDNDYPDGEVLMDMSGYIRDLERLCARARHSRPTLADMSPKEREACRWMYADTEKWGRVVIVDPCWKDGSASVAGVTVPVPWKSVTPRPDLAAVVYYEGTTHE